jgi:hypothetical protein
MSNRTILAIKLLAIAALIAAGVVIWSALTGNPPVP